MRSFLFLVLLLFGLEVSGQIAPFDAGNFSEKKLVLNDGNTVSYRAYQRNYYVSNIEDSVYQYLNIYVPDGVRGDAPVILRTFSNNFHSSQAKAPISGDITGLALGHGCVVCVVGLRGSNSLDVRNIVQVRKKKSVVKGQEIVYTGKMPAPLLDLKSAVRYLRAHDSEIPGSSDRIVAVGTGSNSLLMMMLGVSADSQDFDPYLRNMGACSASDGVFATACLSPFFVSGSARIMDLFQLTAKKDGSLRTVLMNSARADASQGHHIPDSLGAEYFADTFVSDDILDYMVDFDVERFCGNIIRNSQKPLPSVDTASYFVGGLADSIDVAMRRNMCDPFHYAVQPLSISRHWLLSHGAYENPAMFPLTWHLVSILRDAQADVDFRVPFSCQSANKHDFSGLLLWIDSL